MLSLVVAAIGYGERQLLTDVRIGLVPGEVIGLVAPNGWGKTTLLQVLNGNVKLLGAGRLSLDGDILPGTADYARSVHLAPCDDSSLYPHLSVRFHLEATRELWGSSVDIDETVNRLQISPFLDKEISKLSQGMKRQVSLALAITSGARYVLLDEPVNALDPLRAENAGNCIRMLADEGASVLLSSHLPEELDRICDGFLFIKDKKIITMPNSTSCRKLFHDFYG